MDFASPTTITPKALPRWQQLWSAPQSWRWFCGGYGSGKTSFSVWETWLNAIVRHPGYVGVVAAPTFPLLMQSWWKEWLFWFAPHQGLWTLREHPKEGSMLRFANGSEVLLRSTSVPSSNEGVNAAWLVFDEASREPSHESWRVLSSRVRRGYPGRQTERMLSGPPGGPGHWTEVEFGSGPGLVSLPEKQVLWEGDEFQWSHGDHVVVRSRTCDNPCLPPNYERELRAQPGATKAWCDQYLEAKRGAHEGSIWPQFNRVKHVMPLAAIKRKKFKRVLVGTDWGWTHPGVMLCGGVDDRGNVFVWREEVHRDKIVADLDGQWGPIAKDLARTDRAREWWYDPSNPANASALSRIVMPLSGRCYAADNDVGEGVRRVAARLEAVAGPDMLKPDTQHPGLWIADTCVATIAAIQRYKRRRVRGALTDLPQEVDDDPCDALRYLVMGVGG